MQELLRLFEQNGGIHVFVFTVNILLFLLAAPIVKTINGGNENAKQVAILRALNVAFFLLHAVDLVLVVFQQQYKNFFSNMAWMLLIIYLAFIFYNISGFYIRKKFGGAKTLDDNKVYFDTYNSRMINVLATIVVTMVAILVIIKLWGYESLLETTGVFGVVVAFLAITNGIWAPDLYYGLVILNSNMLEDGDVVTFENNAQSFYIINRVNFVYTILLDVANNHRLMIRNAKMIDMSINDLSKKASMEGLRYNITYKVSYPNIEDDPEQGYEVFKKSIDAMFKSAQAEAFEDESIMVNSNIDFSWFLTETGDHALEYVLSFHVATLPSTRSTKTIRSYLLSTPKLINEVVYKASLRHGINLATPITLHEVA